MEAACHTFAITSGRAIKEDRDMRQDSNVNPNEAVYADDHLSLDFAPPRVRPA
jgi:hypothetical protein